MRQCCRTPAKSRYGRGAGTGKPPPRVCRGFGSVAKHELQVPFAGHPGRAVWWGVRVAVVVVKPAVRATVSMVSRHPEAIVGAGIGYALGSQLDRVPLLKHVTAGQARHILAVAGGICGYRTALRRRRLDISEDHLLRLPPVGVE